MAAPLGLSQGARAAKGAARRAGRYFASPQRRPLRLALGAIAVTGGLYLGGRSLVRNKRQKKAFDAVATDSDARVAARYASILVPSGGFWSTILSAGAGAIFSIVDWVRDNLPGTTEDPVELAKSVRDWQKVQAYYKDMARGRSLVRDLQDELSEEDFQKLMKNLGDAAKVAEQGREDSREFADKKEGVKQGWEAQIMRFPPGKVFVIPNKDKYRWVLYIKKGKSLYERPNKGKKYATASEVKRVGTWSGKVANDGRRAYIGVEIGGNKNVIKWGRLSDLDITRIGATNG